MKSNIVFAHSVVAFLIGMKISVRDTRDHLQKWWEDQERVDGSCERKSIRIKKAAKKDGGGKSAWSKENEKRDVGLPIDAEETRFLVLNDAMKDAEAAITKLSGDLAKSLVVAVADPMVLEFLKRFTIQENANVDASANA